MDTSPHDGALRNMIIPKISRRKSAKRKSNVALPVVIHSLSVFLVWQNMTTLLSCCSICCASSAGCGVCCLNHTSLPSTKDVQYSWQSSRFLNSTGFASSSRKRPCGNLSVSNKNSSNLKAFCSSVDVARPAGK